MNREPASGWTLLVRGFAALVFAFLLLPLLVLIPVSLTSGTLLVLPTPGYSLRWYEDVFHNPLWMNALRNSLIIAAITTSVSVVLGTAAAIGIWRMAPRVRGLALAVVSVPIVTPAVIAAVAMFIFHASLGLGGTMTSIVVAHITIAAPFVVIAVLASLDVFDKRLALAAASLGAPPLSAFRHVMLPILAPGILSGAIFAFLTSFDEIVLVLFLGSPSTRTLPLELFSGIREQMSPSVTVVANLLIVVATAAIIAVEVLRRRATAASTEKAAVPAH
ncbi:ABC transporter permease [Rhodoligotrophos defluvii]|uniref:ABC transporter permease n=1 Tax=Rhodoligotrophos defluvii TaxID=2561934 RepID=UPI0010C9DF92|nr:ABC transporter permease [Rhodoligotrophos defluvii]